MSLKSSGGNPTMPMEEPKEVYIRDLELLNLMFRQSHLSAQTGTKDDLVWS